MSDIIRTKADLEKALKEAGFHDLKVYELPKLSEAEKRKIQLDAIRAAKRFSKDGK